MIVLVTRPAGQAAGLADPLRARGATVFELPAIAILPPLDPAPLDAALGRLGEYDGIVFTSVNGVAAVRARVSDLPPLRLAAVGPATAAALTAAFRAPDVVPERAVATAVADALGDVRGLRFLLPRADLARPDLPDLLRARGAVAHEVTAYRIVRPAFDGDLPECAPDVIALTSSSGVVGTRDALAARDRAEWMREARLACIGPVTAATVEDLGYRVALLARDATIPALVEAIVA